MDYLKAMEHRRSKRRYTARALDEAAVRKLNELIAEYNAQANLHMQLRLNEPEAFKGFRVSYGMFSGVAHYIALIGKTDDPERMEKEGYYGELLVLAATQLGLSTCWIGTSYDKNKCRCAIAGDETLDLVIALGYGQEKESFKERLVAKQIKKNSKPLAALMETDGAVPDWFMDGMRAVAMAPTARNRFPFVFSCSEGEVRVRKIGDAERVMVDIGIAKLHFELGAGGGRFEPGDRARYTR